MSSGAREGGLNRSTVLGKVLSVLYSFRAEDDRLSLAELGRRTGLAKGTLHRIVGDLVAERLLDRVGDGYRLGEQLFELGMRASLSRRMFEVAIPFMQDLFARTGEMVQLGIREGIEVVYVEKIGGHRQVAAPTRIGGRMPLYCTAIGKVLLADGAPELLREVVAAGLERRTPRTIVAPGLLRTHLRQVVHDGVAFEFEESTVGICCVAAPIRDSDERAIAAVSVTGPATRFRPEQHAVAVRAAADGITSTLQRRHHTV